MTSEDAPAGAGPDETSGPGSATGVAVERDDGPAWLAPTSTRNHLTDATLADWLDLYGATAGFVPDRELPGYDPRTDFGPFIMERGIAFEAGVLRLIAERFPVTTISEGRPTKRTVELAEDTWAAMRAGAPVIAQAVLRNPENRTYGYADLVVRSDVLEALVPETLPAEEVAIPAPALDGPWHYRVVDVKYSSLRLRADGRLDVSGRLAYAAQVWLYNEALGRLQGYLPPASYLLGRPGADGAGCFDRLGRVDHDAIVDRETGTTLGARTAEALAWVRRLRTEGAGWSVLPTPSIPELWPNLGAAAGWSVAQGRIARELQDLAMLPGVSPWRRWQGHQAGVTRWSDPRTSAALLGVKELYAGSCDAALAANRSPEPIVVPARIELPDERWRTEAPLELYVDIETTSDVDDDFSRLPQRGGQALIFQVGAGRWVDGAWTFRQWTVDRLALADERRMIEAFIAWVDGERRAAGLEWDGVRLVHWYKHEPGSFDDYADSARKRHGDPGWPVLPWFDALALVVQPANVSVTGAFSRGVKDIGKAMHAMGLIETTWPDGVADGNAAEVGAWWCEREAARTGGSICDLALMDAIKAYNEVDCRVMGEIVRWLRANR